MGRSFHRLGNKCVKVEFLGNHIGTFANIAFEIPDAMQISSPGLRIMTLPEAGERAYIV
jgi:hypothetical protein